jgi:LPS sulfotransferase NodH
VHEEIFNVANLSRRPELLAEPVKGMMRALRAQSRPDARAIGFKLMYQQATRAELDPGYWWPGPSGIIADAIAAIEAAIEADRSRHLEKLEAVWDVLRHDRGLRIVHLLRSDHLASYVSFVRAMTEGKWIDAPYGTAKVRVSLEGYRRWATMGDRLADHYADFFAGHRVLVIDFDDLTTAFEASIRSILRFLDVEPMALKPATRRQSHQPLEEVVENYGDLIRQVAESSL